jgi:16S rRNA (uracil1498-N3)-methyltransferase
VEAGPRGGHTAGVTPLTAPAHAFVDDLTRPRLSADDHHHLARALRLGAGTEITASDGRGRWRRVRLTGGPELAVEGPVVAEARPRPALTIAFALVKGDRPELTVQKLTELGIDRIVPFVAERSVVRWDAAKADRQQVRLADISRQAAMQCRRAWLPQVDRVASFAEAVALPGAALTDYEGETPSLAHPTLLVGPEGGWAPAERGGGVPHVRIASHVLRAETASITAGGLLAAIRADLVSESH